MNTKGLSYDEVSRVWPSVAVEATKIVSSSLVRTPAVTLGALPTVVHAPDGGALCR